MVPDSEWLNTLCIENLDKTKACLDGAFSADKIPKDDTQSIATSFREEYDSGGK